MSRQLDRLRVVFDNWLIAEIAEHGGIPELPREEIALRNAVAELLQTEPVQSIAPLIYLASPYSDPNPAVRLMRFERVCNISAKLMAAGTFIHAPVAHRHPILLAGQLPPEYTYWERYDERVLSACDELWILMLPGWDSSAGVASKLIRAREMALKVSFLDELGNFVTPISFPT